MCRRKGGQYFYFLDLAQCLRHTGVAVDLFSPSTRALESALAEFRPTIFLTSDSPWGFGLSHGEEPYCDGPLRDSTDIATPYGYGGPFRWGPAWNPDSVRAFWREFGAWAAKEFGCSRDGLIRALDQAGIESRPVWKPMHLQLLYAGCNCYGGAVAEDLFRRGICLPSSSSLSAEEQLRVINAVRQSAGAGALAELRGAQCLAEAGH